MQIQRDYTIRIGDNWRSVDPQKFDLVLSMGPNPSLIPAVTGAASRGTQVFIDEVLARSHA